MWAVVLAIVRRYSTNKSSAHLQSQMSKLHRLGHKKEARQLEHRQKKALQQSVDKQLRMEDRLKGMDKLVAQAHRELAEEARLAGLAKAVNK